MLRVTLRLAPTLVLLLAAAPALHAQERVLEADAHPLRAGARPEWSESAALPHARALTVSFDAVEGNAGEWTLALRQSGVRRGWRVHLNGRSLGELYPDENAMVVFRAIPAGTLAEGANLLRIEPVDTLPDDIEVGPISIWPAPRIAHLSAASLDLRIVDEAGRQLPGRFTMVDDSGALREIGNESAGRLAIRPGFVYTGDGQATIDLAAGSYRIYAGRGFEYGVDSVRVVLAAGERISRTLRLRREVPTEGWVSADTHVHTLTHSGHGDASMEERAITIAGEGLELPILTDHNVHVELGPVAEAVGVRQYFTPMMGNELTTPVGHFNLFPVAAGAEAPSAELRDWAEVRRAIEGVAGVGVVVLNHGRDIHNGFRPFGDAGPIAAAEGGGGEARSAPADGAPGRWPLPANAMEILNSGSQQTEPLQLFEDWLRMLSRGHCLTPIGSSDSHDVARYIVGQGRTYIRAEDGNPAAIDVAEVVERFRAGAVMVSFGLLAELTVDGRYGPGDRLPEGATEDEIEVAVRVLGPAWTRADRVSLYLNGEIVRTAAIADDGRAGVKWSGGWRLPRPLPGAHLVALAEGPDPRQPFWPIAKPYQPAGPATAPRVLGVSGAVFTSTAGCWR